MRSVIVALSVGLAWPTLASAAGTAPTGGKIAVVPVDVGDGEPALANALAAALAKGAAAAGAEVVRAEEACKDPDCFAAAAQRANATHVIAASVEVDVNDYRVELVAHDASGAARHSFKFDCEICTREDLEARLTREAASFAGTLDASAGTSEAGSATISVTSDPSAARVIVDGKKVGTTPYRGEVTPGRHTLKVEADGYASEDSRFVAHGGGQSSFTLALERETQRDALRPKRLRIAGYTTLGVGLGTVVAGAVLLGIDSRPVQSRCSGDSVDINGKCEYLHDTVVVGAVLTSVGAAAIVTGVALAIVGRRGRKGSRARAAATIGGIRF